MVLKRALGAIQKLENAKKKQRKKKEDLLNNQQIEKYNIVRLVKVEPASFPASFAMTERIEI
jgi:hypothetical protein